MRGRLKSCPEYRKLEADFHASPGPTRIVGPEGSFLALVLSMLLYREDSSIGGRGPALVVLPTELEAENLASDLRLFGRNSVVFPWWGSVAYKEAPSNPDIHGRRLSVLTRLLGREEIVVTVGLRAFLTPVPPRDFLTTMVLDIEKGRPAETAVLAVRLTELGYLRVPRVGVPGEFALRGEVLDIYPPGYSQGLRLVFDFNRIGELRSFDPATQVSTGSCARAVVYPVRECLWTDDRISTFRAQAAGMEEMADAAEEIWSELRERRTTPFEEFLYPLSFSRPGRLLDYFDEDAGVVLHATERLESVGDGLTKEFEGLYRKARANRSVPRPDRLLFNLASLPVGRYRTLRVQMLPPSSAEGETVLRAGPPRSFFGNIAFLKEELSSLEQAGYSIYVFSDTEVQRQRLAAILNGCRLTVVPESISSGFAFAEAKTIVIHEHEIFGRKRRIPSSVRTAQSVSLDTFVELAPGDHVVHVNYGIGRFLGIRRMKSLGNERDYIHLEYADEETVFIPIEQVNLVQRYIGNQGADPRLDKLGGRSWESRKDRVRKSVEDLAGRLVDLYSRRQKTRGHAFSKDGEWQLEFEANFPYEETADQLRCIEEVKADMEKPLPMDRLVCGDVGYGKTEIAMRAAFKAVADGKQVALLAPTTILVEQHFENMADRLGRFPVRVSMLSRFVRRKDQTKIVQELAAGDCDLVIGTHRLLQRDVRFKDLGLLIIDEEQRFGVKDKERLKELKASVDCLTLTATPIPRTLHMSLLKIRDMSVLNTPPANRLPIETHIEEFSEELVAKAIRREVARGGQVFFLHNRIESLEIVEQLLLRVVPEVVAVTAHGQMDPEDLEDVMHRFVHGGAQVLVSTTIIENGIDIPNVNTIIIDRADVYGISQLYQLRGRVGRSGKLAYAYLLYPERRALSELAMKRLQVISDHTELGSGFRIALKDLEVRGAGNLLGREQSGEILSVGFDMYLRLLDEAVRSLQAEDGDDPPEVYLDLDYSGFIPDGYINEAESKMEVYKKIAAVQTEEELALVHGDLADRFGPLPDEVESLLALAEIRVLCRKLFIASLRERGGRVEVEFARLAKLPVNRVVAVIQDSRGRVRIDPKRPNVMLIQTGAIGLREKSSFLRDRLSLLV